MVSSRLFLAFFALFLLASTVRAKDKNDIIVFKNGDRLTGEVKRLEQGQVYFKNSSMYDTIRLDWEKIERIITDRTFIISLSDNERFVGTIEKDPTLIKGKEGLKVKTESGVLRLEHAQIVEIRPLEGSFFRQFHVSVDVGSTLARAESQRTLTSSLSIQRYTELWNFTATADTQRNTREGVPDVSRNNLNLGAQFFVSRKWFVPAILQFQSSSEQSLDLRASFGGGLGRYFKRTNRTILFSLAGVVATRERYDPTVTDTPRRKSLEAIAAVGFTTFRFDKTRFDTLFQVFPSISDPGRIRTDLRANFRFDIIGDLYWQANFYTNYDNRPPLGTRSTDHGLTTGIGWSFN